MEGVEIRARRERMGLGTRALAHALDVNPKKLMEMEAGSRPVPNGLAEDLLAIYAHWTTTVRNEANAAIARKKQADGKATPIDFAVFPAKVEFDRAGGRERFGTGWAGHTALVSAIALHTEAQGWPIRIVTRKP